MTEEQQRICEVAQGGVKTAIIIVDSAIKLIKTIAQAIAAAIKEDCEFITKNIAVIYKGMRKLQCNNWRRMHRMTLLHRNKRSRQGQRKLYITG